MRAGKSIGVIIPAEFEITFILEKLQEAIAGSLVGRFIVHCIVAYLNNCNKRRSGTEICFLYFAIMSVKKTSDTSQHHFFDNRKLFKKVLGKLVEKYA